MSSKWPPALANPFFLQALDKLPACTWGCTGLFLLGKGLVRLLLLGRKALTNLDSVLKSRDITLPAKVCLVKPMFFSVIMYECESWTIKKVKRWRIDAFHLWCWKTLESPLDCKEIKPVNPKGNQFWILIGRTDAETPILWLPDINEEPTHWKRPWCWERLKTEGEGWQRMRWLDSVTDSMVMNLSKLWEIVKDRGVWHAAIHGCCQELEST